MPFLSIALLCAFNIIIFGDLTDVWNFCFFWVFVVLLYSPHISLGYLVYWSSISFSYVFYLISLLPCFLRHSTCIVLSMFCKVSNIVTYETYNKSFVIWEVSVLFSSQILIFFFYSRFKSLVTKLMTSCHAPYPGISQCIIFFL